MLESTTTEREMTESAMTIFSEASASKLVAVSAVQAAELEVAVLTPVDVL
jgi:hypothetical protein